MKHTPYHIQESVASAQQALRAIYDAYKNPCVTLVENRLGDYQYPSPEPDQVIHVAQECHVMEATQISIDTKYT